MNRRRALLLAATGLMLVIAAIGAQKKAEGLLLLDWAAKAHEKAPPVAVLIELGLKDTVPTPWPGSAAVKGAKVVHREGYRFIKDDELVEPDAWKVASRRPMRVPLKMPAVSKVEGLVAPGIVLHLTDVTPDATLILTLTGNDKGKVVVPLKDVLAGKREEPIDGVAVRLVTTTTTLTKGKTEDDFPAAAYGPDGTLWVAYISYTLKDENRRVEAEPLKAQPQSFKTYDTPEFGDQLFVKYFKGGKWSEPIAVTGPTEDLLRCAIAVDAKGTVVVAYSANRNGKFDLYARAVAPKLGKESKLRQDGPASLSPVMCTTQWGALLLACQEWAKDNSSGVFHIIGLEFQEQGYTAGESGSGGLGGEWNVAVAAGPNDQWRIACDCYLLGDYDVHLPYRGDRTTSKGGGDQHPVASSSRFEARPSICYDPHGRLWIAYEEGPEQWGKDWGPLAAKKGSPLYSSRSVRVVCLQDGKLFRPVAELPTSPNKTPEFPNPANANIHYEKQPRYSQPQIGIDGKGRVWLTYRQKFGTRYSTHAGSYWITFARRLDGDKWTEPIEVAHSDGMLDHRPVLLPHAAGGLRIVYNGDGRWSIPETVHNHIYEGYLDLPGAPVEPKLVAHDPGTKDDKDQKAAKDEQENVKRIRAYRVESGSKKYQLLRGEFHRHTEISWDGGPDGSLEDMWRYAIDAAAMDWIGNGDHDNGAGREYSWWLTQKTTDAYHVKGRFTPVFSYERSVSYPHGHRNCVFARRGIRTLPRLAEPDPEKKVGGVHADDTKMLYRYLHELGGICASHTSATGMGTDWRDHDPVVEPIVEIYQGDRMSYEMEGAPRAGYDPKADKFPPNIAGWFPKGFINHALEKGHKLGFQSSSDHWSTHTSFCIVLAEKHDREGIVDALRKRHCYGATDNIILDVKSGSHVMGDEFKSAGAATFEIKVIGTAPLAKVDVLKDSGVVETFTPGKAEYNGKWTDPKPGEGKHYYYIRVQQADGELAWASPMWVEYAK